MVYLILTVVAQFCIGMIIKWAQNSGEETAAVVAINYIPAALLAAVFVWYEYEGFIPLSTSTFWFGFGGGILWPGSFFILLFGIRRFGIAIAGPFSRMAVIVPVLFGLIFLSEPLSWQLALGLFLTLTAVLLISPPAEGKTSLDPTLVWYLPLLLAAMGTTQLWSNLFRTYGDTAENNLYVAGLFLWSIPFAWLYVWYYGIPTKRSTIPYGLGVGIFNFCGVVGILYGLQTPLFADRSAIMYTLVGGIVIVALFVGGVFLWGEQARPRQYLGIGAAVIALALLNLG